jgi:hypothetical protein
MLSNYFAVGLEMGLQLEPQLGLVIFGNMTGENRKFDNIENMVEDTVRIVSLDKNVLNDLSFEHILPLFH